MQLLLYLLHLRSRLQLVLLPCFGTAFITSYTDPIHSFHRFATRFELFLDFIGLIAAGAAGAAQVFFISTSALIFPVAFKFILAPHVAIIR